MGSSGTGDRQDAHGDLLNFLRSNPSGQHALLNAIQQGSMGPQKTTPVRAAALEILKEAVTEHPKLQWDDRLEKIAGQVGQKRRDDPSDGTSQVEFQAQGFTC